MNTVPFILGLAHPTGYPSEILLGWLFSHLWMIGEVSYRLALLNAIEVAAASSLLCGLAVAERVDGFVAMLGALAFAVTFPVWAHATHTDVFGLAIVLVSLTLVLVRQWWRTNASGALFLAALVAGAALGTQGAALLYLASPMALIVVRSIRHPRLIRSSAVALGIAIGTGVLVYSYMPIRASFVVDRRLDPTLSLGLPPGRPFWDWGDPRTAESLLTVVSGAQVAAPRALSSLASPERLATSALFGWWELADAAGTPVLVSLLLLALCARDWRLTLFLTAPALAVTAFIANFPAESDPLRYYILPLWGIYSAAALGVADVLARLKHVTKTSLTVVYLACAVLIAFKAYSGRALFVQRSDHLGFSYIHDVIEGTTSDSIIIAPWTYATPIAYAAYVQRALGSRVLVPGDAADMAGYMKAWLSRGRVYAISESVPSSRAFVAMYRRAFNVIPNSSHDPKLYELRMPEEKTTARRRLIPGKGT